MAAMQAPEAPAAVLNAWKLADASLSPLGSGLINHTWLVVSGACRYVLQQVNPVFSPDIHSDIRVVTAHLRSHGMLTPELLPTTDGRWWVEDAGSVFRLMTHVEGVSHDRLATPAEAREAGALLARFHRTLDGLDHEFRSRRLGVHDTGRHLAALRQALIDHAGHRDYATIRPLADDILRLATELPKLPAVADRIVHGDPKINNLLFDAATGRALCLIDLDTLGRMPLPLELGDAFRSWCNPAGEDNRHSAFAMDLFAGAIEGYAGVAAGWITPEESGAIVSGTLTIYIELAARFCADALRESYFGWDSARFPSRSAHNQVRAASQLTAARALADGRDAAEEVVARAFRRTQGRSV